MSEKRPTIDDFKRIPAREKNKLKRFGVLYADEVLIFTRSMLIEYVGLSPEAADKVLNEAVDLTGENEQIMTLKELEEKEKKKEFLTTGSKNLDNILQGGYLTKTVTEFAGEYGTGKTQTCYTAIATALLPPDEGGLNTGNISVILMDTEEAFTHERMLPIFRRFDIDPREAIERIIVMRPRTSHEQLRMILSSLPKIREKNARLFIIDSITKLPRIDFEGRGELYERQRMILLMVESLRRIAKLYNMVALITNQVVAVPEESFDRKQIPAGGNVLGHTVDTRLYIKRLSGDIRLVEILDSSWLPPRKTKIRITDAGITDVN